jgi:hypothetical protein
MAERKTQTETKTEKRRKIRKQRTIETESKKEGKEGKSDQEKITERERITKNKRERNPCNYVLSGTVPRPSVVNAPLNQLAEPGGISHRDVIKRTKDASIYKITTFFTHFLTPNTRSLHNYLRGMAEGQCTLTWEFDEHLCHSAMWRLQSPAQYFTARLMATLHSHVTGSGMVSAVTKDGQRLSTSEVRMHCSQLIDSTICHSVGLTASLTLKPQTILLAGQQLSRRTMKPPN